MNEKSGYVDSFIGIDKELVQQPKTKTVKVAVKSVARDSDGSGCPIYLRTYADEIFVYHSGSTGNVLFNVVYQNMLLLVPGDYVCIEYIHQPHSIHTDQYFKSITDIKHVKFQPEVFSK